MATSPLTDHQTLQDQDHHHPIRRTSGRRKSKAAADSNKTKQRRRGMGMAKLEQLRLQDTSQPPAFPPFASTLNSPAAFPAFHAASDYRLLHHHVFPNQDSDFLANTVVKCYSLHCNACHKKKRVNGEDLGSNDRRFLGLHIGENQNVVLNEAALRENGNKVAEESAVEMKGSSGVLKEYDFFPKARSTRIDSEAVRSTSGGSSMAGFDVDLSLKLSY